MSTPTQSLHPWRATIRTLFAFVVGVAATYGVFVQELGLNPGWHAVVVGGVIAGAITRVLANPLVESLLQGYVPWLSAQPKVRQGK